MPTLLRRFADLALHRAIKYLLGQQNGEIDGRTTPIGGWHSELEEMLQLGQQCSLSERRADEATRDVADWLKCDFMQDHVGKVFSGIITSVTSFGFFVRLDELFIDGLVHVSSLDNDYYRHDNIGQRLIGESGGRVYRLGDAVEIRVEAVHMDERKIDFSLISSRRQPRGAGKTACQQQATRGGNEGKHSRRRRSGKQPANFEPDSAFRPAAGVDKPGGGQNASQPLPGGQPAPAKRGNSRHAFSTPAKPAAEDGASRNKAAGGKTRRGRKSAAASGHSES